MLIIYILNPKPDDNIVKVGDLSCVVGSSTETEIVCELEAGPEGIYDVTVVVVSSGLATGIPQTHTVEMEIFSNSPYAGSIGGGTTVTVLGSGFPATLEDWQNGSVMIGNSECKVIETSYGSFKCITSVQKVGGRDFSKTANVADDTPLRKFANFRYSDQNTINDSMNRGVIQYSWPMSSKSSSSFKG